MKARVCLALLLLGASPAPAVQAAPPPAMTAGEVPSLAQVLNLARRNAPTVLVGQAQVATARAGRVGAGLPPVGNPYLEVTGERPVSGDHRVAFSGMLWLPLEIAGQRSGRLAEADAHIKYQRSNLALARSLAIADAVRAYGMALIGRERLRVLDELLELSGSEATLYQERYKAGDATAQDTRLSELDLARYGVMVEEAKADVVSALSELGRVTGIVYDTAPRGPLHAPEIAAGEAIQSSPVIAAARAEANFHEKSRDRWKKEAAGPVSLMLLGGTNELGEPRAGGGLAYTFPALHRFQGEQARAEAERSRALIEERVNRRLLSARVIGLRRELAQVRRAIVVISDNAEPAARAAVEASEEMRRAGKGEFLALITSRRDLGLIRLRRTDLLQREWNLTSDLVAITGVEP